MKVIIFISAIITMTISATFAATPEGTGDVGSVDGKTLCAPSAAQAVKKIVSLNVPPDDMKYFEVRKVNLISSSKDLNSESQEKYTVLYGYKTGEMSWENFEVEVTLHSNTARPKNCVLIGYEAKF